MPTIRITAKLPPVMFAMRMSPLRVTIDGGEEQKVPWSKTTEVSVSADRHQLHLYVPWAIPQHLGPADVELSLQDGEVVDVRYKPPWIRTMAGRVRVTPSES